VESKSPSLESLLSIGFVSAKKILVNETQAETWGLLAHQSMLFLKAFKSQLPYASLYCPVKCWIQVAQ
jgi:hypothetical protein